MKHLLLVLLPLHVLSFNSIAQPDEFSESQLNHYQDRFRRLHDASYLCALDEEDTVATKTKFRFSYIPSFTNKASVISIERIKRKVFITYTECSITKEGVFELQNTFTKQYWVPAWGEFLIRINEAMFWHLDTNSIDSGFDGSQWLVEGIDRTRNKNHDVYTWAPGGSFEELGNYLFRLCDVERYY